MKATGVVLKSPRLRRAILRRAAHSAKKAWATPSGTAPANKKTKPSPRRRALRPRRPFTVMNALGTAAHHTFEVRAGVGLVFEPFIGRRGAVALWATALPAWTAAAWLGEGEAIEKWLALNNGAGLAGGIVHFVAWPWELRGGIPQLVEAEGLTPEQLPAYNKVLQLWVLAGALALTLETPRHARRWAFAGLLLGEPLRRSAIHHFRWAHEQAERDPERWSPVLRDQAHGRAERAA
ncbi:MAG: hypothetical protein ABSH36_12825 [Solirubrobacteraceae bacterium]